MAARQRKFDPEMVDILRRGEEYRVLSEQPGWKRLLDELEKDIDHAIRSVRECQSSDEKVKLGLVNKWLHLEKDFHELHIKVYGAIEQREALLKEIAEHTGEDEHQVQAEWQMEEMIHGE